jgi:hypothetical protein
MGEERRVGMEKGGGEEESFCRVSQENERKRCARSTIARLPLESW